MGEDELQQRAQNRKTQNTRTFFVGRELGRVLEEEPFEHRLELVIGHKVNQVGQELVLGGQEGAL